MNFDMKKTSAFIAVFFICISSVAFAANDTSSKLSYDKNSQQIKSDDGQSFLKFEEKDEGNTSYYFDYFGGKPSVVHDSDSLDSYSVFSVIERDGINFKVNCIYADFKSGSNGVASKEGLCGIGKKVDNKSSVSGSEGDGVINNIIDRNSKLKTSYFINDKVKCLPIIIFQNERQYAYKLYESKSDLENGKYKIISCENGSGVCEQYENDTWVVVQNTSNPSVDFDVLRDLNGKSAFEKASATKVNLIAGGNSPFEVKSSKSYFQAATGKKMKSYLVKGDKITLLNLAEDRCLIEYTNAKNKVVDGYISCQDLNIFN